MSPYRLLRNLEFNSLFEHFFIASVVTIVLIRFYLHFTGYPQIGADGLHIAHMLWGGLLLMIALLGSLAFLNNDAKHAWAIVGGAGFGTFIDELGKFVTRDNNYFYQPTFALIYVIFVVLYLLYKQLWFRAFSPEEYLMNTVEELKEVISKELDKEEIRKAIAYLQLSDPNHPLTRTLTQAMKAIEKIPTAELNWYQRLRLQLNDRYTAIISNPWMLRVVVVFFVVRSLDYLIDGGGLIFSVVTQPLDVTLARLVMLRGLLPLINFSALVVQALLTVMGALRIRSSRLRAFMYFRNSLIVSLIVLQVFNYYQEPLVALASTIRDVFLLGVMEFLIAQEKKVRS